MAKGRGEIMWPFTNKKKPEPEVKRVNTIGYANAGAMLCLHIMADGTLRVIIDTKGVDGFQPMQKAANVYCDVKPEHLQVIQQFIGNIEGGTTRVEANAVLPISDPKS